MTVSPTERLDLARRLDWRFLLADPRLRRVAIAGRPDAELVRAIAEFASEVVTAPDERADVVVVHAPSAIALKAALEQVAPGGSIVIELVGRAWPGRSGRLAAGSAGDVAGRLRHAGFVDVHGWWVWPDHPNGLEIVPLERPALIRLSLARRRSSRMARLKARAVGLALRFGLAPAMFSATTVVGRRPDRSVAEVRARSAPLIDAYLEANRARLGLEGLGLGGTDSLLVTPRFMASAHLVGLIVPPKGKVPTLVAKVHRLEGEQGTLDAEAACLGPLAVPGSGGTPGVPRLISHEPIGGHAAILESALGGTPLDPREVRRDRRRAIADVATWTRRLERAVPLTGSDDRWERLVLPALDALDGGLGDEPADLARLRLARQILEPLGSAGLPVAIEHGDLSHPNLLRLDSGAIGAIDWELGEPVGYPLVDLLFFLGYAAVAGVKARATTPAEHARRIGGAFFGSDPWATRAAEAYADGSGIGPSLIRPLLVLTWVRALSRLPSRLAGRSGVAEPDDAGAAQGLREHRYHAIWQTIVDGAGAR